MTLHADTVWRVCALYFQQQHDRNDVFQEAFLKYALADDTQFESEEHTKAWLIRVTRNTCLDVLKSAAYKTAVAVEDEQLESAIGLSSDGEAQPGSLLYEVMEALQSITDPPRTPLYLAVCEEYTAPEIATMLDAPVNTVYSWIARGKEQLRKALL